MSLTIRPRVSDGSLVELNTSIQDAGRSLQFACASLRECYTIKASSINEFADLRHDLTNSAKLYSLKILPLATMVVQNIQDFAENYTMLTFSEFKDNIEDLVVDVRKQHDIALYTKQLHMEILTSFKSTEDKAKIVLKKFEKDVRWYEEQAKNLRQSADSKYNWANVLGLLPGVILVAKVLELSAESDIVKAIANDEESRLAVTATKVIEDVLIGSIQNFVEALAKITGFFSILESELTLLSGLDDEPKRIHYIKCKAKAEIIANSCKSYIGSVPNCQTDLKVIPDNFDKNYVEQWLAEKLIEIDNLQPISLLEWGNRLFEKDRKVLAILGSA